MKETIYEMGKSFGNALTASESPEQDHEVRAKDFDDTFGFLGLINYGNRIEPAAPHRIGRHDGLPESGMVASRNSPANPQRPVAYVDTNRIHRTLPFCPDKGTTRLLVPVASPGL